MSEGLALGEGLYWMAEKLRWGYEDIEKDPAEALRLYRQAADLGWSDALVRIGEFYEQGHVVEKDPTQALRFYKAAYSAGNPYGYTSVAQLLARTTFYDKAEQHWAAAFSAIAKGYHTPFHADDPGSVIHAYIGAQLRHGLPVRFLGFIKRFRPEVLGHHQMSYEPVLSDDQLEKLETIQEWLIKHLGPVKD